MKRKGRTVAIIRTGRTERPAARRPKRSVDAVCQCGHTWRKHRHSQPAGRCRHVDVIRSLDPDGVLIFEPGPQCPCTGFQ